MSAKVSNRLNELNATETVGFARSVVSHMTGNDNFPTPSPALSLVADKATELETATSNAANGGKELIAIRNQKRVELQNLLIALGYYVEVTADGDATIILSAGMGLRKTKTPAGLPEIPSGLSVAKLEIKGRIVVYWATAKNARMYILQRNDDPNVSADAWKQVKVVPQTFVEIDGISLTESVAFRVCGIGTVGEGAFSGEVYSPDW